MNERARDETPGPRSQPAIRTMRSDIEGFLKPGSPSLASVLARQAERPRDAAPDAARRTPRALRSLALGGAGLLVAVAVAAIAWRWLAGPASAPAPELPLPAPLFSSERTAEQTLRGGPGELALLLRELERRGGATGSFTRIQLRIREPSGTHRVVAAGELFALLGSAPPAGVLDTVDDPPQLYLYHQLSGARLLVGLTARNPARTIQGLLAWERTLPADLEPFFLGQTAPPVFEPYRDITYRNIHLRYLALDAGRDLGIGYLSFPAKRLVIIATSEEALRRAADRLFTGTP